MRKQAVWGEQPILEAREVSFRYPDGTQALCGVSVAIPQGKKSVFLGPNGSGKSTLFMHFNGLFRPQQGKILFAGREISYQHAALRELRKKVGVVFQDPENQLFSASVFQEISFGPLNLGLPADEVARRVEEAIRVMGLQEVKDKPTHFLSYGQKKRVAMAGILAMKPQVLVCDEPLAGLDAKGITQTAALFDSLKKEGITVVFSTHDADLAYAMADYVFLMREGKLIGEGPPAEIFTNAELLAETGLEKPWVIEVFEELQERGRLKKGGLPRTKEALLLSIRVCRTSEDNEERG